MIHLPRLSHCPRALPSALDETAGARLLAAHKVLVAFGLELVGALEVVLDRRHVRVLGDVEVVVEVGAVRAQPRECARPAHARLVRGDLGGGGARDADKGRGARGEVREGRDVVGEEGARGAAGVPGRVEHEVVDDELAVGAEEVGEGECGFVLAGGIKGGEGVGFGDFDDGEGAALGGKSVAGAGELFLLFEEGEAGGTVFGGRTDL